MKQEFKELKVSDLLPNPHNFRTNFSGPDFDEFVESIRQKGVVQPILVRPMGKKFEIVFGERRFRGSKQAGSKTVPAIIRELSDSEAYELMIIENLQREDLSEFEEARGFKLYLDKNGDESLVDLADRTGLKPAYIRRRVTVLKLPAPILEAWKQGGIRYGYLEQLSRLDDETEIMALFEDIMQGSWEINSVSDLKRVIDEQAIAFKHALFDLEKEGCLTCHLNSDVQLRLFEIDAEKTKCSKPGCFFEKQEAWLTENWKTTKFFKEHKTNGFGFQDKVDRHQCEFFRTKKVGKDCRKCDAFVTLFSGVRLNVFSGRVCIGGSACFKKTCAQLDKTATKATDAQGQGAGPGQGDEPRVAWHGEHFREIFLKEAIPQRFADLPTGSQKAVQLALFALVKSERGLCSWFAAHYTQEEVDEYHYFDADAFFDSISKMSLEQASEALKAATLKVALLDGFLPGGRRLVAEHIGIDLCKEWVLTEEYLNKKTIAEMLGMGERFGIFSDPRAKAYLSDTLNKKDFGKCKKKELISVFLESGIELAGKVPEEILN